MKLIRKKKGQALVVSIAAFLILFILVIAVVEAGHLMYMKTRSQNIADSGAMEAGLWYARGLNTISLTNKVLAITGVAGIVATILTAGEAGGATLEAIQKVQKAQDIIAGTGEFNRVKAFPYIMAAMVLRNGKENGAVSVPFYNVDSFAEGKCLPSFNVRRRYLSDIIDIDSDNGEDRYYYTEGKTGRKVYVDRDKVAYNENIKSRKNENDRVKIRKGEAGGNKFLKREKAEGPKDVPLDIIETSQDHTVLVVSYKDNYKQVLGSGFFTDDDGGQIKPDLLLGTSFVSVSGGKMDFWETDGAGYEARMEHIKLPDLTQSKEIMDALGQESEGGLSKAVGFLSDNLLMH